MQKKQNYVGFYTKLDKKNNKENYDQVFKEIANYFHEKIKNNVDF